MKMNASRIIHLWIYICMCMFFFLYIYIHVDFFSLNDLCVLAMKNKLLTAPFFVCVCVCVYIIEGLFWIQHICRYICLILIFCNLYSILLTWYAWINVRYLTYIKVIKKSGYLLVLTHMQRRLNFRIVRVDIFDLNCVKVYSHLHAAFCQCACLTTKLVLTNGLILIKSHQTVAVHNSTNSCVLTRPPLPPRTSPPSHHHPLTTTPLLMA